MLIPSGSLFCPSVLLSVNVSVKRVGGGYGAKVSRSQHIAAACALGAYVTGR